MPRACAAAVGSLPVNATVAAFLSFVGFFVFAVALCMQVRPVVTSESTTHCFVAFLCSSPCSTSLAELSSAMAHAFRCGVFLLSSRRKLGGIVKPSVCVSTNGERRVAYLPSSHFGNFTRKYSKDGLALTERSRAITRFFLQFRDRPFELNKGSLEPSAGQEHLPAAWARPAYSKRKWATRPHVTDGSFSSSSSHFLSFSGVLASVATTYWMS